MEHEHHGADAAFSPEEALALLRYMADHNLHHAEELRQTEAALPETAANLIRKAADLLQSSAELTRQAIMETEG